MVAGAPKHTFTTDEFLRLVELDFFGEDERVELLEGEIYHMSPTGPSHGAAVARLNRRFVLTFDLRALVWNQSSVRLGASMPEPDLALLVPKTDYYANANPEPEDILLVVEVAQTSLAYDRAKLAIYARNGVQEVWIADLSGELLEVYREPGAGAYKTSFALNFSEPLSPLAFPDETEAWLRRE